MPTFEVTLTLTFNQHDPEYICDGEQTLGRVINSFDHTHYTSEELAAYVKSFEPNKFVEGLTIYNIVPESARWLNDMDDIKISFKVDIEDEYEMTVETLVEELQFESLEDGSYEGSDNGWVVPTTDKEFEYGLMDYRMNPIIVVQII